MKEINPIKVLGEFYASYDFSNPNDIDKFVNQFPPTQQTEVRKIVEDDAAHILDEIFGAISRKLKEKK